MFSSVFFKIKNNFKTITPCIVLVLILGAVGYFAWLNHNDFEKAMVSQAQTQLLVTALSTAQSVERNFNVVVSAASIYGLLKYLNDVEKVYVFIINDNAKIISYPYSSYVGKDILALTKEKIPNPDWLRLNAIMQKVKNGEHGSDILDFLSEDINPKIVKTLIAFAPLRIGKERDSIVVAMEYNAVANPLHKNVRDNLFFMAFISLAFIIFGAIYYKILKEKNKLAISDAVCNIINKQLRSEIEERKKRYK